MFNDSQNLATSIPPHKFMFCSTLRDHGTLAPLRWMRQPEPFVLYSKGVPISIIHNLLYSLYAQISPVMLSASAWKHTHGARYQNRTGTYCLEGSRSTINLIRRKEWPDIAASEPGGQEEKHEKA